MFSLAIVLDRDNQIRFDLYKCNSLKEMDEYIRTFKDSGEVRKKYEQDISEFMLDFRKRIKRLEDKNKKHDNGSICLLYHTNGKHYRLKTLYQNDNELLDKETCLKKIEDSLNRDFILNKIMSEKSYLISEQERMFLRGYFKLRYKNDKKNFIDNFIGRLRRSRDEYFYLTCRSLISLCNLNNNKGISNLELKEIKALEKEASLIRSNQEIVRDRRNSTHDDVHDEYFRYLIENGSEEELHNYLDVDEIDKNSNYFNIGRKK